MSSNGGPPIFGPDGRTNLSRPKDIIVMKVPAGRTIPVQVANMVSAQLRTLVVVLPQDMDIYTGKLATKQLEDIHQLIHTALQIKEVE